GPMARTVEDVGMLFEVLAGYDPADPFSAPVPLRKADLTDVRIGVMEQFCDTPVQEPMRVAVRRACTLLEQLHIPVEPFRPEGIDSAPALWWFCFAELTAPCTREVLRGREQDAHWTGTELLNMVPSDRHISGASVVEKLSSRDRMRVQLLRQMQRYPVLLLPP